MHLNYYTYAEYLKKEFGCRVHRVSIDAGLSCPNKDGTLSSEGCIFCNNEGFSHNSRIPKRSIEQQIKEGIQYGTSRYKAKKFIAYFQAYTNTFAPVNILKQKYDTVRQFKNIAGISIGTRPDCINKEKLDLIQSYTKNYKVWLEYGLQSVHEKTLSFINRNHTYLDFVEAVAMTQQTDIKTCAHVILGLPGETEQDMFETAREISSLNLWGIKIHPLHVVRGTKLEEIYKKGEYEPMSLDEYTKICAGFLKILPPQTVIVRITANCPRRLLIAPEWINQNSDVLRKVKEHLQ